MGPVVPEILPAPGKIHILHHAVEGPVHGRWMPTGPREHGHEVSPGTVYPMLRRMERFGWLTVVTQPARHPKARRSCSITPEGQRTLGDVRPRWTGPGTELKPLDS